MINKKNTFIFLGIILLNTCLAYGQNLKWDSLSRPASYDIRREYFKKYSTSESDIVFLGNSITAGIDWNELLNNSDAKNRGISGDYTYGLLERLFEISKGRPAKIFILIGVNDIAKNIPDGVIINNIERIVKELKSETPKTKIYLQTVLPVNNTYTKFAKSHFNKDEHIAAVNLGIKAVAKRQKVELIDLHPHFLDQKDRLNSLYTYDGLHLSARGYELWKSILQPYLN
ncbi:GDSL-type esterase/lipase family protein [Pseudopedobacter beijingensis]|uniref:GDSL-type esterase/lipase family protein n=1 Tax=Pseudopedobacter beijingensis TaxID=1207056 RepID=A0ABW4IF97_9SPHI